MRTRNSNFPNNSNVTIPRRRNRGRAPNVVEPELRTIVEVAPMAERTMEELLRAPTEGYGEAIVLPEINADHFEIKTNLLQLVQANPFHGFKESPKIPIFRDDPLNESPHEESTPQGSSSNIVLVLSDDGVLDDGASWLMEVDTGESAKSTALGATTS
ncbi:hypothetical protein Tco_0822696 [Tanacetum coccineum]|uniref:Reverse transcriptase domain-containing protein n=1 Tax=Tanacetum coccineum TaxID=301880 RepID=A0ABQ5AJ38_9ASTR